MQWNLHLNIELTISKTQNSNIHPWSKAKKTYYRLHLYNNKSVNTYYIWHVHQTCKRDTAYDGWQPSQLAHRKSAVGLLVRNTAGTSRWSWHRQQPLNALVESRTDCRGCSADQALECSAMRGDGPTVGGLRSMTAD